MTKIFFGKVQDDDECLKHMGLEVRRWCEKKGWRIPKNKTTPDALGRTFGDEIALLHSELSEALEAFRDHGFDHGFTVNGEWVSSLDAAFLKAHGKPAKPEGVASELADVLIRLLDTCEHIGVDLFEEYRLKMDYNGTRAVRHGGKAL